MPKRYRCFDPGRAATHERRAATRRAVDAGVMEPPIISLTRTLREAEEKEEKRNQALSKIKTQFDSLADALDKKLREKGLSAGAIEIILQDIMVTKSDTIDNVARILK